MMILRGARQPVVAVVVHRAVSAQAVPAALAVAQVAAPGEAPVAGAVAARC